MKLHFWLLTIASGTCFPSLAQNLQTVTTNGNTTNQVIIIDPAGDAFRSFNVRRANGALNTEAAFANNKTYGQFIWRPDLDNIATSYAVNVGAGILQYYNNGTYHNIWHAGRMGHTSGLDADMLDGLHASSLFRYGSPNVPDPLAYAYPGPGMYYHTTYQPANGIPDNSYGVYLYLGDMVPGADYKGLIAMGANNGSLYTRRKTAGTWEPAWKKIWDSDNFKPGEYLTLSGGQMTGPLTIGTTAAQNNLNVNGNIKARKVKVTVSEWPDYVFEQNYPLMPLPALEAFITVNKRLPEVPSAETVQQEGVELGDNQAVLLKKIEELTLYIIEQHQRQEKLEKRIAELENKQ